MRRWLGVIANGPGRPHDPAPDAVSVLLDERRSLYLAAAVTIGGISADALVLLSSMSEARAANKTGER